MKIKGANLQDAFIETRVGEEVTAEEEEPLEGLDELTDFVDVESPEPPGQPADDVTKEVRRERR